MHFKFWLFLIIVFCLPSCHDESELNSFDFDVETEFRMQEQYVANNLSLIFSIAEINDSRCPTGVYCIWAGTVHLKIALESPVADTVEIFTHEEKTAISHGFKFEIVDVSPYPDINSELKVEDYRVKMKITH